MSEKRGPGRPRGTSPHGLPPGSDGAPTLRIRMAPEDLERVRQAGGSTWAREVLLAALDTPDLLSAAWDFLGESHPGLPKEAADLIHALAWRLTSQR